MNQDNDATEFTREPAADPAAELRAAREALNMSVEDVAEELHLDNDVVAALDRGDLDSLGAPVFVKGYLRSYARLVGLDEARVAAGYTPAQPDPDEFRSLSMQREVRPAFSMPIVGAWVAMVLLVIGSLIYVLSGDSADDEQAEDDFIEEPATLVVPPAGAAATAPADTGLPEGFVVDDAAEPDDAERDFADADSADADVMVQNAAENTAPDNSAAADRPAPLSPAASAPAGNPMNNAAAPARVAAESATETAQPARDAPSTVRLELDFSGECWVELADARQRLLYGLEKAGSRRSFDAELPLRFYLGDAGAVQIRIAGADYAIPAGVRTGRKTARFAVRADDLRSLR